MSYPPPGSRAVALCPSVCFWVLCRDRRPPAPRPPLGAREAAGPCTLRWCLSRGHWGTQRPPGVPLAPHREGGPPFTSEAEPFHVSALTKSCRKPTADWFGVFSFGAPWQRLSTQRGAAVPGNSHPGQAPPGACDGGSAPLSTPAGMAGRGCSRRRLRALTSPGLALPYQEGPTAVARLEQQLLRLLPADALVQPPVRAAGVGRASRGCAGTPRARLAPAVMEGTARGAAPPVLGAP